MRQVHYKAGYKYKLINHYTHPVSWLPNDMPSINHNYFNLISQSQHITGLKADLPVKLLLVKAGYSWDGASGPAIDTKSFMRGSLVHDVFYQMIREGLLDPKLRPAVDNQLYEMCREDGMNPVRAYLVWIAVRLFGGLVNKYANKGIKKAP